MLLPGYFQSCSASNMKTTSRISQLPAFKQPAAASASMHLLQVVVFPAVGMLLSDGNGTNSALCIHCIETATAPNTPLLLSGKFCTTSSH